MAKFRKKPVVIEAERFVVTPEMGEKIPNVGDFFTLKNGIVVFRRFTKDSTTLVAIISTLEGHMIANDGDWIITGVNGELYPCKPDIFEKTYEKVIDLNSIEDLGNGNKKDERCGQCRTRGESSDTCFNKGHMAQ